LNQSKVEVSGFEARHYDSLLNMFSLGSYAVFIRRAIAKMNIQPDDRILDLGCGTGRNSCLMAKYLSAEGSIMGLDIGEEMISQFEKKCRHNPHVEVNNLRIDEPLPFKDEFNKAFLSFVFHGFPDDKKEIIIKNIIKVLKPGGQLFILDYNEFDLEKKPRIFRKAFAKIECPLALDYVKVDWKERLSQWGFDRFEEYFFYLRIARLLKTELPQGSK
jgi:demethylmenaquinone methyltransferase/2-methoxy-6-polyprenyl-1,4-benzoquinol methylase